MSCEHFAIFFPNLPFMSYIRQNYSISKKQQKTAFLKKVLSIKLPDSHFQDHWGFPMQRRLMGKKLGFLTLFIIAFMSQATSFKSLVQNSCLAK